MGQAQRDCPWDLLPWAYELGYDYGNLAPGERWAEFRRRMRGVKFENAAHGVDHRAQMDYDSNWCPSELRQEHRDRIYYWRSKYFPSRAQMHILARVGLASVITGLVFAAGLVFLVALSMFWRSRGWFFALSIPLIVLATPVVIWRVRSAIHRRGIRRSLFHGCCPTCGYPLADEMIGSGVRPTAWIPVGPARCPECGTHWPLIPPPVPLN